MLGLPVLTAFPPSDLQRNGFEHVPSRNTALNMEQGYVAPGLAQGGVETTLPIFNVERVRLQFNIASDFVAGQVANDVLVLALATGRLLRIDLESPQDIDGTHLPLPMWIH